LSGLLGPILFGLVLAGLTLVQYDFLRSLGWHPLNAPTFDWPSGLALGPYGWIMTITLIISGGLLVFFALGLRLALPADSVSRTGTLLLVLSGLAMLGLAFTTDPTIRTTPATWHGRLHDASFVALGLTLLPAILLLGLAFHRDPRWENLSFYTFLTIALVFPAFWLKGAAFYVFLGAIIVWIINIAIRLRKVSTKF
jgi:hypothetical protein